MKDAGLDIATYQWYFTIPWTIVYTLSCLWLRSNVPPGDQIAPLKRPLVHWVLLGILLIAYQTVPTDLSRLYSFDIPFIVFTLFMADAYWDFV